MNKTQPNPTLGDFRMSALRPCGLVGVLLVAVIGGCGQNTATGERPHDYKKAAIREVSEIAAVTATLINVYMDARVTDMLVFSKTCVRLRTALTSHEERAEASRILGEWLKISGAYEAIMLLNENGVCVASAPDGLVGRDFSGERAFDGAVKGQLTISDAYHSDLVGSLSPKLTGWASQIAGWTVAIAVPITEGNDTQGALLSYIRWRRLVELLAKVRVGATGYVFVLNGQNQVIIHPTASLYGIGLRDSKINLPELDQAVRKRATSHRYRFTNFVTGGTDNKVTGLAYLNGYGNFRGLAWTVGAGADESEISEDPSFWRRLFR